MATTFVILITPVILILSDKNKIVRKDDNGYKFAFRGNFIELVLVIIDRPYQVHR